MRNGNVLDYIENVKPDIERRIALVKGITAGLACLHSSDPAICHADLKPANVLLDLQMNAVLCDFGLASFVSGSDTSPGLVTSTSIKGTPRYMAPELLMEDDITHTLKSDVWGWACTVFQVLTGLIPYAEIIGESPVYMAVALGKPLGDIALLLPNDMELVDSESALPLRFLHSALPRCWDFDLQRRPSIRRLLSRLSDLSSHTETGANGNEDVPADDTQAWQDLCEISSQEKDSFSGNEGVPSGDLEEGMKLAEAPEDPAGNCAEVESAQGDKRNVPTAVHPDGEGASEENSGLMEGESAVKEDADGAQLEDEKTVPPATLELAPPKISPQPPIMHILAAVCILSLFANIFLLLRNVDPLPRQNQDASRPTYQERDL